MFPIGLRAVRLALAAALPIALVPASASAAASSQGCAPLPTTKAFAKYKDLADYSLAPGGTFETSGWTLTGGAKIVSGNETLGITPGSKALKLPFASTATSPEFCVDETHPHFRFAMKAAHKGGFRAIVLYRNDAGSLTQAEFTSSSFAAFCEGRWIPSAFSPLATKIRLGAGQAATVQIRFISTGNPSAATALPGLSRLSGGEIGSMTIDSVMVDPYRRG